MSRKLFKTGNSTVVSIPAEYLEPLGLRNGSPVEVALDRASRQIVIRPAEPIAISGVDEDFARQVDKFIEQYRDVLEKLAK